MSTSTMDSGSEDEPTLLSDKILSDVVKQLGRYSEAVKLEQGKQKTGVAELQTEVLSLQQQLLQSRRKLKEHESHYLDTTDLTAQALQQAIVNSVGLEQCEIDEIVAALLASLKAYAHGGSVDLQAVPLGFERQTTPGRKYFIVCGFGMKMCYTHWSPMRVNFQFPSKMIFDASFIR